MGVLRYGWRASAFLFGLTDRYPAFRLVAGYLDPADHPAVFYSAQPLSRRRATVLFRLVLIVPFAVVSCLVALAMVVLLVAGWCAVLVLGHWPLKLRPVVVACFRWWFRVAGYGWLIVDDFPPFRFETDHIAADDARDLVTARAPDPREAFGPPWPRLVGGETYGPPAVIRWPIVVGLLLLALNAGLPPLVPSKSANGHRLTASALIPPPATYYEGSGEYWPSGFITPAEFDENVHLGTATTIGLTGDFEETYYNVPATTWVDIELMRFSSRPLASLYLPGLAESADPFESPSRSEFVGIPGAYEVDGTKPDHGFYSDLVLATKGSMLMYFEYESPRAGPIPKNLVAWVERQYDHI